MIQEDQDQMCSNSSNGGGGGSSRSSSKKLKQRKVPQRGLGVAQLEKIRIEEQQKKDTILSPSPIISPTTTHCSSMPTFPFPSFTQGSNNNNNNNKSKSSIPIRPPSPPLPPTRPTPPTRPPPVSVNHPTTSPLLRAHSMPSIENFHFDSLPTLNPTNGGGFNVGWPSLPINGDVNSPKLWHHHELNIEHKGESSSSFLRDLSLPFEGPSVAPLPDIVPKWQHCKRQQSYTTSSMMINVSSTNTINSASSSVLHFPMEPPSNQNYLSNYVPFWPHDEKVMNGMKRPCPIPLDDPPIPIFHSKFAAVTTHVLTRTDESKSLRNGGTTYDLEPPIFRDLPSCSSIVHEPTTHLIRRSGLDNGKSNGGLLSLAPPAITPPVPADPISQQPSMFLGSHNTEMRSLVGLQCQVSMDALVDTKQGGSSPQRNYFSFLPSSRIQGTSETPLTNYTCNSDSKRGENIDLNLRL